MRPDYRNKLLPKLIKKFNIVNDLSMKNLVLPMTMSHHVPECVENGSINT